MARDAAGGVGGAEDMSTEGQWQLTGSAAERYERVLAPAIFAPWAADLIELAQPQDGERVLDVACGTGVDGFGMQPRRSGRRAASPGWISIKAW